MGKDLRDRGKGRRSQGGNALGGKRGKGPQQGKGGKHLREDKGDDLRGGKGLRGERGRGSKSEKISGGEKALRS